MLEKEPLRRTSFPTRQDARSVAMLMHRAGLADRSAARKRYRIPSIATADDLVDRMFIRERPRQLWQLDLERHEAP